MSEHTIPVTSLDVLDVDVVIVLDFNTTITIIVVFIIIVIMNHQVRNSAAFLLVSLVPSPHFRQTFRTPRNPPTQLRESIEALDGIDTVRRLLEFLLSLLRYLHLF